MFAILKGRLLFTRMVLIAAAAALLLIGLATIYAVGHPAQTTPEKLNDLANVWKKQAMFACVGLAGFIAVNLVNYRKLGYLSYLAYAATLVLLAVLLMDKFVDIPGVPVVNGTRRWIRISLSGQSISLQPSEICKLVYILALGWYLRYRSNYRSFTALIGPFILTFIPMILILLEPDLGTVMLMMPILFTMLFVAGAKLKHLLLIILLGLLISPVLWMNMRPYQRMRISSVLLQNEWVRQKISQSPRFSEILLGEGKKFSEKQWRNAEGFHLIRSKYAIASGGMNGFGYRKGPFLKYNFLPERQNDFIFSIIAHQWGFRGCLVLMGLYALIIACGIEIAIQNTDPFGRLVTIGIIVMFAVEVIINVSMTLGLMPITGLTLPLVSYGGSSLLVSMTAIGLLNNIGRCRPFRIAANSND